MQIIVGRPKSMSLNQTVVSLHNAVTAGHRKIGDDRFDLATHGFTTQSAGRTHRIVMTGRDTQSPVREARDQDEGYDNRGIFIMNPKQHTHTIPIKIRTLDSPDPTLSPHCTQIIVAFTKQSSLIFFCWLGMRGVSECVRRRRGGNRRSTIHGVHANCTTAATTSGASRDLRHFVPYI